MPVLGRATLELNADSARLEQDLGRAVQNAAAFGTMIGQVLGQAIGAGVEKMVGLVNQAIETGDELSKLSQKTGMSVENLSQLRVAAQLADVSMGTLKAAVKGLYETLSQAGRGSDKKNSAFEAIGLDVEKLRSLKPDEMFRVITERLAQYEDGANRAAIQTAIFGRAGAELSPLINELSKTTELAKQLGITMGKDTAEAAERFKDNLTASRMASEAMGMRIAQVLLPTLEKFSGFLVDNAKNTERLDMVTRAADAGLKIMATGVTVVGTAFELVAGQIARMAAVFGAVVNGDFKGAARIASDTVSDVGTALGEAAAKVVMIWDETGNKVQAGAEKNGEKLAAPAIAATEKIKKARKEADAEFQAFLKIRAIEEEAGKFAQDFYRKQGDEIERVTRQVEEQAKFLNDTLAQIRYNAAHGGDAGVVFDEDTGGFTKIAKQVEKTSDFARQMGLTFESAFEKAVRGGQSLRDVFKGILSDIAGIVLRKTVTEPLGNAVTEMFKGFDLGSIFGGNRAQGGPIEPGKWYIAGEHGPEPIWGGGSGAFAMGYGNGGGGGPTFNVDMRGASVDAVARLEAFVARVNGSIETRAIAAVADQQLRGNRV